MGVGAPVCATGTSEPQWEIQAFGRTFRTPFGTISNR